MAPRWPFSAAVVALVCAATACFLAASIETQERMAMLSVDPAETAEQAGFALELYAIGALNLLALIAFLLRRSAGSWWLALGLQAGVFVLAVIEGLLTDMGWLVFSSVPLLTLFALFAFRDAQSRLKRQARSGPSARDPAAASVD